LNIFEDGSVSKQKNSCDSSAKSDCPIDKLVISEGAM